MASPQDQHTYRDSFSSPEGRAEHSYYVHVFQVLGSPHRRSTPKWTVLVSPALWGPRHLFWMDTRGGGHTVTVAYISQH